MGIGGEMEWEMGQRGRRIGILKRMEIISLHGPGSEGGIGLTRQKAF